MDSDSEDHLLIDNTMATLETFSEISRPMELKGADSGCVVDEAQVTMYELDRPKEYLHIPWECLRKVFIYYTISRYKPQNRNSFHRTWSCLHTILWSFLVIKVIHFVVLNLRCLNRAILY